MAGYIGNRAAFLSSTSGADIDGNVTIDGDLTVSGNTVTIDSAQAQEIRLGDNDKMTFGDATGGDLQIYHDGSHSYIDDAGTGDLRIRANNLLLKNASGEDYITATSNGGVSIAYDNSTKLATTSTGIDVTGTVTADGLTVDGGLTLNADLDVAEVKFQSTANAKVKVVSSTTGNSILMLGDTDDNDIGMIDYDNADNSMRFVTNTSERMRIDSSGNIGIGTSAPVNNTNRATLGLQGAWGGQLDIMVGSTVHAQFGSDNFNTGLSARIQSQDGIVFRTNGSNERMRIDSSGAVGIGTTSPSAFLHIAKTSGATIINLQRTNTNTTGSVGTIQFSALDDHAVASIAAFGDGNDEGAHLSFRTTSAASTNSWYSGTDERMRITSSGNVGIGTTSPSEKIDVAGNIKLRNGSVLYVENPGGGRLGYLTTNSSGTLLSSYNGFGEPLLLSAPNGYMQMSTGGTPRIRVNNTGTTHFYKGISGTSIKVVNLTNSFQNILAIDGALGSQGGGYCICATHENSYRQGWILTYSNNGGVRVHFLGGDEYHTHSKDVEFRSNNGYLQARRVNYTTGRPLEIFQVHGAFTADYD